MEDFSGDSIGHLGEQEGPGSAHFVVGNIASQWGHVFVEGQHLVDAGGGASQCFERAGAEGVDPNTTGSQVIGQVADGRFQCCLADSHHVVAGDTFFATKIGHGGDCRVITKNILGGIGNGDQAVGADLHGHLKTFPTGLHGVPVQVVAVGEGDRVEQEIDFAELLGRLGHHGLDIIIVLDVHGDQEAGVFIAIGTLGDPATIFSPLVIRSIGQVTESTFTPFFQNLFGNGPGDGTVVGNAENHPFFPVKETHGCLLPFMVWQGLLG